MKIIFDHVIINNSRYTEQNLHDAIALFIETRGKISFKNDTCGLCEYRETTAKNDYCYLFNKMLKRTVTKVKPPFVYRVDKCIQIFGGAT